MDCLGTPSYCSSCCQQTHAQIPFHCVESWAGSFFQPSWLRRLGVNIYLGHGSNPCCTIVQEHSCLQDRYNIVDLEEDESCSSDEPRNEDMQFLPADAYPRPGDFDVNGTPIMIIVDTSGIHHFGVQYCLCPNAQSQDIQLMSLGFYPATFDNLQTAFSFRVLDDFLLDNLECKTTASNYYSKLRRITNSSFPQLVPVSGVINVSQLPLSLLPLLFHPVAAPLLCRPTPVPLAFFPVTTLLLLPRYDAARDRPIMLPPHCHPIMMRP